MSVLERLAHPLMGYDSREALAPKARRLRQESVERVSRGLQLDQMVSSAYDTWYHCTWCIYIPGI